MLIPNGFNKKGQTIIVFIMVGIIIFIMAINMIPALQTQINSATNVSEFNCSDTSLTSANQAACIVLDIGLWYFISVCIAVGLALIAGKRTITGILTSIFVFIVTVILITPLKDFIVQARNATHLNCAASSISVGARMLCLFVDLWLFYFVMTCIAAAITWIVTTRMLPKNE